MTASDPRDRLERARAEIGETAVSPALARLVGLLVLLTAVLVPAVELSRAGGSAAALGELAAGARRALAVAGDAGPLAGNRELLAAMDAFEERLDEGSAVAEVALPPVQWLLTAGLGVGNDQALTGRADGWLFFHPALRYAVGPPFLDPGELERRRSAGKSWQPPPQPDPRPALLDLARRLERRGIALLVLPTPVKASIHPQRFARGAALPAASGGEPAPLQNPSFAPLLAELEAAGVAVYDPAPELAAAAGDAPQFLRADTHWTPAAIERVAEGLARRIAGAGWLPPRPPVTYPARAEAVQGTGDLARMLRLPAGSALFPPQRVTVRRVSGPGGQPWRPDPAADVLLLGDSFSNVFSFAGLGWGEGAGLAEQLALLLERPVDRIAVNAGGALGTRQRLYRELAAGGGRLAGKRLVIYQFSTRELVVGDWRLLAAEPAAEPVTAAGPATAGATPAGEPPDEPGAGAPVAAEPAAAVADAGLGEGFVVWESNRSGDWRIWTRRLDGGGLRRLSPEEPGMQHCCPHISPDGTRVVYLSRPVGKDSYPEQEVPGPLRLIAVDGSGERQLAAAARTYGWGNRAAVWRNDDELIYVGGEGRTWLLDLATGAGRRLTDEPRAELGWLIDATLRWATHAAPSFSLYDADARRVVERRELGGCEPYFSHDGRWGYFIAAGGGPVDRIDLATREHTTLLRKNDPRMPGDESYVYFPMASRDGRLFAFGASGGEHDHFRSDYNIYVARSDPATLQLEGTPVRLTDHPATDRYPDVFPQPLPLGRHSGEAPLTVTFPGAGGEAEWDFGDGSAERTAVARHTYERPGVYEVTARRDGELLTGRVVVEPARPPRVADVALRSAAQEIVVTFDEPVDLTAAVARLASGREVSGLTAGGGGRSLVVELAAAATAADTLYLSGVADRAQRPNRMPPQEIAVAPPAWPSDRGALLFLWQTADRPNELFDPELRADVADPLTANGRARLDRFQRMVLDGGWFSAPERAAERVLKAASRSNEISLEATVTPAAASAGLGRIVTFSGGPGARNLTLGQEGRYLVARVRTGPTGPNADKPQVRLFPVQPGSAYHVVVTYSPGRLTAYRNGEPVVESTAITSGLNRWRSFPLTFGAEPGGAGDWAGTLEGVALYGRVLEPPEVKENFLRYRDVYTGRQAARRLQVRARLVAVSRTPALREISPYRRALAVYEYEVEEVLAGTAPADRRLRVAHWVLLDGERQPLADARPGSVRRLTLEPFADNPQLEAHYLSDTLDPPAPPGPLWFAID